MKNEERVEVEEKYKRQMRKRLKKAQKREWRKKMIKKHLGIIGWSLDVTNSKRLFNDAQENLAPLGNLVDKWWYGNQGYDKTSI